MYAIEKIENDLVIAENLETKEQKTFQKDEFPFVIKEGTMFIEKDKTLIACPTKEQERRHLLREKMERLKHHE